MAVVTAGNIWKARRCAFRFNKSDLAGDNESCCERGGNRSENRLPAEGKVESMLHLEFQARSKSLWQTAAAFEVWVEDVRDR